MAEVLDGYTSMAEKYGRRAAAYLEDRRAGLEKEREWIQIDICMHAVVDIGS